MRRKNYNKYTSFIDRFPFIIFAAILVFAIIFIFQFKAKYPLPFFSSSSAATQDTASASYSILVASPNNGEVFDFINKNESVPIEIKSSQIEGLGYKLNLVINDKDIIKTFSSPPYKYDWQPAESGEYTIVANLVDNNSKTISSSNKVNFFVKYTVQTTTTQSISTTTASATEETVISGAPTINLEIFEGPTYSAGDDICYYRVKATVTGNPAPSVSFSKDDSGGVWGSLKTQINLTRNSPNYTLTAKATNSAGQAMDSITLNWGCGQ
jgi:hypothetical protein